MDNKPENIKQAQKLKSWFKEVSFFELLAIIFIVVGALVIVGVFAVASLEPITQSGSKDILDYSEFLGGFVGSLWALAGVLLFYASLGSQKAELDDQRQLLVKQIDEIVKQTEESRKQNEMFKQQQVEETFFQLMRFQNEIVSSIVLETSEMDFSTGQTIQKELTGRKTFVEYYDTFKRFFQDASDRFGFGHQGEEALSKSVESAYQSFFKEYQSELGHYFRNLYNILMFIDELGGINKAFYLSLLLAQLTNYELGLLFFHGLSKSNEKYKVLLEKYGVLDNVPTDELTKIAFVLYEPSAFGEGGFKEDEDSTFDFVDNDNVPDIEDGFLTGNISADELEGEGWDMQDSSELEGSISDRLSALSSSMDKDNINDVSDTENSGSLYSAIEEQNDSNDEPSPIELSTIGKEHLDLEGSIQLEQDISDSSEKNSMLESDWTDNMLSLDDVSTGWEDGEDEITSDETTEYNELEEMIAVNRSDDDDSKLENLKHAFSGMAPEFTEGEISDSEYNDLFVNESDNNSIEDNSQELENENVSSTVNNTKETDTANIDDKPEDSSTINDSKPKTGLKLANLKKRK